MKKQKKSKYTPRGWKPGWVWKLIHDIRVPAGMTCTCTPVPCKHARDIVESPSDLEHASYTIPNLLGIVEEATQKVSAGMCKDCWDELPNKPEEICYME